MPKRRMSAKKKRKAAAKAKKERTNLKTMRLFRHFSPGVTQKELDFLIALSDKDWDVLRVYEYHDRKSYGQYLRDHVYHDHVYYDFMKSISGEYVDDLLEKQRIEKLGDIPNIIDHFTEEQCHIIFSMRINLLIPIKDGETIIDENGKEYKR